MKVWREGSAAGQEQEQATESLGLSTLLALLDSPQTDRYLSYPPL